MNSTRPANKEFKYIQSLDGLRGLAVVAVLLVHGTYGTIKGGWLGVDLFFVLSGFLITSLLQKEYLNTGDISFARFYARRALRLFPPLIVCILLANLLWTISPLNPDANRLVASSGALFYFTNFINQRLSGNMVHLWSLSVEEHFYLFWPLVLLFFILKHPYRRQVFFLSLFLVVSVMIKLSVLHFSNRLGYGPLIFFSRKSTFCQVTGILMGALLAIVLSKRPKPTTILSTGANDNGLILSIFGVLGILLFTLASANKYWRNGGFIFTDLIFTLLVLLAVRHPNHYLFSNKILNWLGKRSYGIYVYHYPIFLAFESIRHQGLTNFIIVAFLRFFVSIAFAALSYQYLEQPVLKFKKRFGETIRKQDYNTNPI